MNKTICQGETYQVGIHVYTTTGTYVDSLTTNKACDSIITTHLTVNPIYNLAVNKTICQGQTYQVGTHTYTSAGTYVDSLITAKGCDSIITTNLIVNPVYNITVNKTICQGESYHVGTHTYTLAGTYVDNLTTIKACDSIITTILTVNPSYNMVVNTTICQGLSYQVGTHIYTTSGTYIDNLTTNKVCDSIITTHLTVKPSYNLTVNKSICQGQSHQVGTHVYTTTGTYLDSLKTKLSNCDSVINTHLTVNPVYNLTVNKTICQGQSYQVGMHVYNTSGTYLDNLLTKKGCDSNITTNLTVNPSYNLSVYKTICQGQTYKVGSHIYATAGTYIDHLFTSKSCDSIITTHLTVDPSYNLAVYKTICQGHNTSSRNSYI